MSGYASRAESAIRIVGRIGVGVALWLAAGAGACQQPSWAEAEIVGRPRDGWMAVTAAGDLVRMDVEMRVRWGVQIGLAPGHHRVVIAPSGAVYVRVANEVQAFDDRGVILWRMAVLDAPESEFDGIVVRPDSAVLVLDQSGTLRCFDSSAKPVWSWVPPHPVTSAPVVGGDSTVYVMAGDELHALSAHGDHLWAR